MLLADFSDVAVVGMLFAGGFIAFHLVKLLLDHRDYRKARKAFLEQQRLLKALYHFDKDVPTPPMKVTRKDNVVRIKDETTSREKS